MIGTKHPRLWTPALRVVGGSAIAVAFGIGFGWKYAVLVEVVTLCGALLLYELGADDTDVGALVGGRADERQQTIRLKAATTSLAAVVVAMLIACVIEAALHASPWPYLIGLLIAHASYGVGLRVFGVGRDEAGRQGAEPSAGTTYHHPSSL